MGNTIRCSFTYLQDPKLVRRIQECLGVKQIHTGSKTSVDVAGGETTCHDQRWTNGAIRGEDGTGLGGNLGWLATKRRKRLKQLSPSSTPEPEDIVVETIPMLDIFFRLATELGYEPFYITVIPFLIWNVDTFLTRHIIVLWIGSMYMGQACKALFRVKRPASPPVIRLEVNPTLETEYGFPSSHATVSTTIPFYFAYRAFLRYEASMTTVSAIYMYTSVSCYI